MIGWPATERNNAKTELYPIFQRKNGYGSFLPFTAFTERNFLTYLLQNYGILQRQNGETAAEERQRNGGNRAYCESFKSRHC